MSWLDFWGWCTLVFGSNCLISFIFSFWLRTLSSIAGTNLLYLEFWNELDLSWNRLANYFTSSTLTFLIWHWALENYQWHIWYARRMHPICIWYFFYLCLSMLVSAFWNWRLGSPVLEFQAMRKRFCATRTLFVGFWWILKISNQRFSWYPWCVCRRYHGVLMTSF